MTEIDLKFNNIYKNNTWGNGSGWGSSYKYNRSYVNFLQKYLKQYKINSVLDIGCGDWQLAKRIEWSYDNKKIKYIGADVSSYIIEKNKKKYGNENIRFIKFDVIQDKIPNVDLVIIKDVLQHLNNKSVKIVLKKLKRCKRVLVINDTNNMMFWNNSDIKTGDFRSIDINQSPFTADFNQVHYYRPTFQHNYFIIIVLVIILLIGLTFYYKTPFIVFFYLIPLILLLTILRFSPYKSIHEYKLDRFSHDKENNLFINYYL
uniref:Methyltransferase domain protein n=1 Tax=Pithovirus LCPAC302 TaxID=2506593 RepID=A0A481ZAC3_9VIRU|nr:MAG: methyltransferase domain protein [Pithovirus LCPAC302]